MELDGFLMRFQAQQFPKIRAVVALSPCICLALTVAQTFGVKRGTFRLLLCPDVENS